MPFWLTNLASALFGVRLRTFALATLIGIVPATLTFATAGAGLDSIIAAQRQAEIRCEARGGADCRAELHWKALVTPKVIAAFAALGALSLLPVLLRRRAGRRRRARPEARRPQGLPGRPERMMFGSERGTRD
jgi:uncharacterized membrane protein YdjX (TVP38/TMEM64 family)